jgi:ribosomal protein L11 methyltransferase
MPDSQYNIVVANILAGPLKGLVSTLTKRISAKGYMVLSGILEGQADDVIAAYAPYIKLSVWKKLDGWVALSGQLNS